jgi:hypothetical protein
MAAYLLSWDSSNLKLRSNSYARLGANREVDDGTKGHVGLLSSDYLFLSILESDLPVLRRIVPRCVSARFARNLPFLFLLLVMLHLL